PGGRSSDVIHLTVPIIEPQAVKVVPVESQKTIEAILPALPQAVPSVLIVQAKPNHNDGIPQVPLQFDGKTSVISGSEIIQKSILPVVNTLKIAPATLLPPAPITYYRPAPTQKDRALPNGAIGRSYGQRLRRPPFKPNPASSVLNSKSSFG
ncbi:unnamed protein product, partial [Allacma fusca]